MVMRMCAVSVEKGMHCNVQLVAVICVRVACVSIFVILMAPTDFPLQWCCSALPLYAFVQ